MYAIYGRALCCVQHCQTHVTQPTSPPTSSNDDSHALPGCEHSSCCCISTTCTTLHHVCTCATGFKQLIIGIFFGVIGVIHLVQAGRHPSTKQKQVGMQQLLISTCIQARALSTGGSFNCRILMYAPVSAIEGHTQRSLPSGACLSHTGSASIDAHKY